MKYILLLDSSNTSLTVALASNKVIESISYEAWQSQSEHMIPEINNLLEKYNVDRNDIDGVAVRGEGVAFDDGEGHSSWLLSLYTLIIAGSMRIFLSISRSLLGEAGENPLVGQLRAVKLDLHFLAVDPDISGDPEGDGILDPGLGSPPLGQLPLEVLALVVLGVLREQVLGAEELRDLGELVALRARQLNADFREPAPLGACAVELEEPGQLREGQRNHVQATAEHEPERVLVGRAPRAVGNFHLGHGHGS